MKMAKACSRPGQGLGAEIYPDAVGWLERGEQIAGAAADLQHALARRDQEAHELVIVGVVGRVDPAPALGLIEAHLDVFHQLLLARIGKLKGSDWLRRVHQGLWEHAGPDRNGVAGIEVAPRA